MKIEGEGDRGQPNTYNTLALLPGQPASLGIATKNMRPENEATHSTMTLHVLASIIVLAIY